MSTQVVDEGRRPVDDTLDYAMFSALLTAGIVLLALTTTVLETQYAIFATTTTTFIFAFYITPRIVAWWTRTPVETLVSHTTNTNENH